MAVMSAIVLRESPARKLWIAAAISILGVGWILTNGQLSVFLEMDFNLGDILILAAIFSWAIYGVVAKKAMQEMSVLTITAYGLIVSSIVVLPIGIWEINSQIQPQINLFVIIAVLFISIGPTILSFLCWNQGVKLIGPLHASIYLNTIPIYTIILSVFYLDQAMSQAQVIGAVMVLGGSFYASKAA
jgi:drug/metabolite transporter (DMT)-like permease